MTAVVEIIFISDFMDEVGIDETNERHWKSVYYIIKKMAALAPEKLSTVLSGSTDRRE